MKTDVTVFRPRSVTFSGGMISERINGPEMAFDAPDFVFVDLMKEAGFELTGPTGRCGYVQGVLTTRDDHFISERTDGSGIDGTFSFEGFKGGEGGGVD